MKETTDYLAEEEEKFLKVQEQDEQAMAEKIDYIIGSVTQIALVSDNTRVHETAVEVKRVWKAMRDAQEQGLLLNQRQKIFGLPVQPFTRLNNLMKEFEPLKSLWLTASGEFFFCSQMTFLLIIIDAN